MQQRWADTRFIERISCVKSGFRQKQWHLHCLKIRYINLLTSGNVGKFCAVWRLVMLKISECCVCVCDSNAQFPALSSNAAHKSAVQTTAIRPPMRTNKSEKEEVCLWS